MFVKYDLHIHTALSPCGHRDMTPNNILNMASLNALQLIAITDHNSCDNVKVVMDMAKERSILVVPAMEIETKEEIHVLCFFSSFENVYNMQCLVHKNLPNIENKPLVFGEQLVFNEKDDVVREEKRLLLTASQMTINEVYRHTNSLGGVMIPAHVDRPSYSIISNLGMIPEELDFKYLEVSRYVHRDLYTKQYPKYNLLQCSDAHELGYIGMCEGILEIEAFNLFSVIQALKC